jgi:hypothetical protein
MSNQDPEPDEAAHNQNMSAADRLAQELFEGRQCARHAVVAVGIVANELVPLPGERLTYSSLERTSVNVGSRATVQDLTTLLAATQVATENLIANVMGDLAKHSGQPMAALAKAYSKSLAAVRRGQQDDSGTKSVLVLPKRLRH